MDVREERQGDAVHLVACNTCGQGADRQRFAALVGADVDTDVLDAAVLGPQDEITHAGFSLCEQPILASPLVVLLRQHPLAAYPIEQPGLREDVIDKARTIEARRPFHAQPERPSDLGFGNRDDQGRLVDARAGSIREHRGDDHDKTSTTPRSVFFTTFPLFRSSASATRWGVSASVRTG